MSWIGVGVGGASTIANLFGQAEKEKATKQLAAKTAEFSPWTGLKPGAIAYANPAGAFGSGVATAFGVHQGLAGGQPAADPTMGTGIKPGTQWAGMDATLNPMSQQNQLSQWQQMMNQNTMPTVG